MPSNDAASPLLMGQGPKRMTEGKAPAKSVPGEFVLRDKYRENQYFRDAFHGWSTGEGMWRGLTPYSTRKLEPAKRAMNGEGFNPAADFLALLEAGWLTKKQIAEGIGMQQRHERVLDYARSRLAALQKVGKHTQIRKARVTISDLDRKHYEEKKAFMAGLRKELQRRRPDLLCTGVSCVVAGGSSQQGARAPMPPPPVGRL